VKCSFVFEPSPAPVFTRLQSVFAHCKRPKNGAGKGLGTTLHFPSSIKAHKNFSRHLAGSKLNLVSFPDPILQLASFPDPILQLASFPDPILQLASFPGPILQLASFPGPILQLASFPDPILQVASFPGPILQLASFPGPILQLASFPDPILQLALFPGPILQLTPQHVGGHHMHNVQYHHLYTQPLSLMMDCGPHICTLCSATKNF